ncbi:carbon-nitrogen hydrolase family protein [Microlunatus aurantiacus]|uniref:Carbon-nitrogen hydrolase family protein n=1 Tax=Microlunatus aurantiacus TaxID=446786 RepID=A0ABP7DSS4_9ACTN
MPLRIAITQPPATSNPQENGRVARQLMRKAATQNARLIVFPEGHLSGYAKEQVPGWDDVNWALVRDELKLTCELSRELGLWTVLGSAHRLTPPRWPHNSMYVISDQGRIVDRYDKRFCSNTEVSHWYTPGSQPTVFDLDGYRFGVATCVEINFPHLFSEYADLGVDCLLLPTYPVDSIFRTKAAALAAINTYWIAVCSVAQRRDLFASELIAPDGSSLGTTEHERLPLIGELDRDDPALTGALQYARPWRARARETAIYNHHIPVDDPRSLDRTSL